MIDGQCSDAFAQQLLITTSVRTFLCKWKTIIVLLSDVSSLASEPGDGIEADRLTRGWRYHRQLVPQPAESTFLGSEGVADVNHGDEGDINRTVATQVKRKRTRTSERTQGMVLVFRQGLRCIDILEM